MRESVVTKLAVVALQGAEEAARADQPPHARLGEGDEERQRIDAPAAAGEQCVLARKPRVTPGIVPSKSEFRVTISVW